MLKKYSLDCGNFSNEKNKTEKSKNSKFNSQQINDSKKSIYNVSTIFQMNNFNKDIRNIFTNNELIFSETKKLKNTIPEIIIPLANSVDEKIGLDKIEFIDQRTFRHLNVNNLQILNERSNQMKKKQESDHDYEGKNDEEYLFNNFEQNKDQIENNMSSTSQFVRKTSESPSFNEKEENFTKTKIEYNHKIPQRQNKLIDAKIQSNISTFKRENEAILATDQKLHYLAYKTKNSQNTIEFCDYDEEIFDEVSIIDLTKKRSFGLISQNSKKDFDSSFIKNNNNLSSKKPNNRMFSCDNIYLTDNNQKFNNLYNYSFNNETNLHNQNIKNELTNAFTRVTYKNNNHQCDMETHYLIKNTKSVNFTDKKNFNNSTIISENTNGTFSYSRMKNNIKNIENYTTVPFDNTIVKYKEEKTQKIETEKFTKFLINNYVSNLHMENIERENNEIFKNYISVKEKVEDSSFRNMNNSHISPLKNKNSNEQDSNLCDYEINAKNHNLKKFYIPKTYITIQSQTESEYKSEKNFASDKTKRTSKNENKYDGNYYNQEKKIKSSSGNLNLNKRLNIESKINCNKSDLQICPECEAWEIPKTNDYIIQENTLENNPEINLLEGNILNNNFLNFGTNSIMNANIGLNISTHLNGTKTKTHENRQANNTNQLITNFLHSRSNSNNLNFNNLSNETSNILSDVQFQRNSKSINKDESNSNFNSNLLQNKISLNSRRGSNLTEEIILYDKMKFATINNSNYGEKTRRVSSNNYQSYSNRSNLLNYNSNNLNSNQNNKNFISNNFAPFSNVSEFNSQKINIDKIGESADDKIYYSYSPPQSIKKLNGSQNRFFTIKSKIFEKVKQNENFNNNYEIDEYIKGNAIINDNRNSLKMLNLSKEVMLLKKERNNTRKEIENYENELKTKNLQIQNIKKNFELNNKKLTNKENEKKTLEFQVEILKNQIEKLKNCQENNKRSYFTNNSINMSNYLNSSINRSILKSKTNIDLMKSIHLIKKNTLSKRKSLVKDVK